MAAARLRGGAGGGVIGWIFTEQSFELRFGEMRAGKLSVFVHCDRLRTMLSKQFLVGFNCFYLKDRPNGSLVDVRNSFIASCSVAMVSKFRYAKRLPN